MSRRGQSMCEGELVSDNDKIRCPVEYLCSSLVSTMFIQFDTFLRQPQSGHAEHLAVDAKTVAPGTIASLMGTSLVWLDAYSEVVLR